MSAEGVPLRLRMRVLQLRMEFLSGKAMSREEEQRLLSELELAVAQLQAAETLGAAAPASGAGSERRQDLRTAAAYPAILSLVRANGETFKNLAITRDVARHGMSLLGVSLVSPFEAKSGETVSVDLGLPNGRRVAGIRAEVRWCNPVWVQPGHFLVGLRFLDLSPDAKAALESAETG